MSVNLIELLDVGIWLGFLMYGYYELLIVVGI